MESITEELIRAGIITAIDSGIVATEEVFKALDGKSPNVLHLATHAFFFQYQKANQTLTIMATMYL